MYGKTGSGKYIDLENPCVLLQHGWFVGWCIKDKEEGFDFYSFALHVIEPYDAEKSAGTHAKEIMLKKVHSILS